MFSTDATLTWATAGTAWVNVQNGLSGDTNYTTSSFQNIANDTNGISVYDPYNSLTSLTIVTDTFVSQNAYLTTITATSHDSSITSANTNID